MPSEPRLRLLEGPEPPGPLSGLGPAVGVPRPPRPGRRRTPGRPWDHLTAWWPPQTGVLWELSRAAGEAGVPVEVALTLTLERGLAAEQLSAIDPELILALDELAVRPRAQGALSGAAAVYLRQLSGGFAGTPAASPAGPLCLPVRVAVRLSGAGDERLCRLLEGDLALALAWERAALLENRTIAEWAAWRALGLLSR